MNGWAVLPAKVAPPLREREGVTKEGNPPPSPGDQNGGEELILMERAKKRGILGALYQGPFRG